MRPDPEQISYLELDAQPQAPFCARRLARATLTAWQLPPDIVETAELLVSEMITNAIHAEAISLTLRLTHGQLVIEVFDNDPSPPVLADAALDAESGRGLMLVQALAKEWGHNPHPGGGKTVFAVLGADIGHLPGDGGAASGTLTSESVLRLLL